MENITIEIIKGDVSLKLIDPKGNFNKNIPAAALFNEMVKISLTKQVILGHRLREKE